MPRFNNNLIQIPIAKWLDETNYAYKVRTDSGREFWAAKSQCVVSGNHLRVPQWILEKAGLDEFEDLFHQN